MPRLKIPDAKIFAVLILLFAAYLRLSNLVGFVEWPDEIWSVWHVHGPFQQAMARVPNDWPPLFSALTWIWQQIVGLHLETARYLMVLISLFGLSFIYRTARRLHPQAGLPTMLTLAVAGYGIFAGVDVRAYGLLLMFGALAFWLTLRWLHKPTWRRGIPLTMTFALLVYTSYTSLLFIAFLSLYVLVMRPRQFPRWLLVGVGTGILLLPLIPAFLASAGSRLQVMEIPFAPLPEALANLYAEFGGTNWFLIPLALAAAISIFIFIQQPHNRLRQILLLLWVLAPIAIYFTATSAEFWKPRYLWWVLPGLVLLIGLAAAQLPKAARGAAFIGLILLPFVPVNWDQYHIETVSSTPFRAMLSWFAQEVRPGDVMVIDPKCTCGVPYGWDYFVPLYFPTGHLPIVKEPGMASRVWYLSTDGWEHDTDLFAQVTQGRKPSIFVGPWYFLLRLYEGPPLWDGADFGDHIHLNGVETDTDRMVIGEDDTLQVKLWWSTDEHVDADYSISVAVLDNHNQIIAQSDGPAFAVDTPQQTSAWQTDTYYEDYRTLNIPGGLPTGEYRLVISVYQWWDGVRLKPATNDYFPGVTSDDYLVTKVLMLVSY